MTTPSLCDAGENPRAFGMLSTLYQLDYFLSPLSFNVLTNRPVIPFS